MLGGSPHSSNSCDISVHVYADLLRVAWSFERVFLVYAGVQSSHALCGAVTRIDGGYNTLQLFEVISDMVDRVEFMRVYDVQYIPITGCKL